MIFIDASRYSNTPQRTGVEAYSFHLINELVRLAPEKITLISPRSMPLDVPQLIIPFPRLWTQVRLSWEVWRRNRLSFPFAICHSCLLCHSRESGNLYKLPHNSIDSCPPDGEAGLRRNDIAHEPIQTLFIPSHQMPIIHPANTIITIHDVAFKRFPECYSLQSRLYLDWGAKFAVKHAHKIIVPSQVTKNDLVEFYKSDPQKIVVIPHGYLCHGEGNVCHPESSCCVMSHPEFISGSHSKTKLSGEILSKFQDDIKPYFLFIGRIERKKNLLTLIKAFNQFHTAHPGWRLVLAGKPGVGGDEIITAARKNTAIELPDYVDETVKIALLKNAFAFVFPSLYEGFGFPLLEAMEFGLPIIASDIPASREVAGNAALFFQPNDHDELAARMEQILAGRPDTSVYSEILKKHSWQKCAEKTFDLLTKTDNN